MNVENQLEIKSNLLVIDDEVEITRSLFRQFRRKYNVHVATSAMEAMPILEKEHIQVVLSDQRMPGMTGIDFFSKIKDKYPDALKLILTGYSDIEAVIGAINEGQVFRYLTKPWNPVELNLAIEEAFDKYELITNNRVLMHKLKEANSTLEKKVEERTQELAAANVKLTNLNIEKNKYIGIVAHDLRNPIGAAFSFSDLLIEDFDTLGDKDKREFIQIINERCNFSLNLISEFLDASKIEAGIFELKSQKLNYINFVKDCVTQNQILARNKLQTIQMHSEIEEISLHFDKNKMEQVINNLLSNAIKYSHPKTKIRVEISLFDKNVLTKVIDEGQGIPAYELSYLFNPYKTTSVKSTANEKSTGLGLAIVKKIIEAHNGSVSVTSTPKIGSEFTFTLPLKY